MEKYETNTPHKPMRLTTSDWIGMVILFSGLVAGIAIALIWAFCKHFDVAFAVSLEILLLNAFYWCLRQSQRAWLQSVSSFFFIWLYPIGFCGISVIVWLILKFFA